MSGAALHVERLSVAYGARRIVHDLTLPPFERGTVTALVGPNGSGKSTVLKAIAQIAPSNGRVALGDVDLRKLSGRQRAECMGFMPQGIPIAAELSVIESIIVSLQAGRTDIALDRRALEILDRIGIARLALRPLNRLSGGERQLAGLGQAIALSPQLLFLDEPTSALDLARQYEVMRLARSIAAGGATVIVVLHDLTLAANWADRMVVLHEGRLHSAGRPADVLNAPMLREVYGVAGRIESVHGQLFAAPEDMITQLQTPKI